MAVTSDSDTIGRSPGQLDRGYVPLPVEFEKAMRHFPASVLKTFLVIRFRTIFDPRVQISTAALARIAGLSQDSVRKALIWLEFPERRLDDPDAQSLPPYITTKDEKEHQYSGRLVQAIYVQDWKDPRKFASQIKKARAKAKATRDAQDDDDEE